MSLVSQRIANLLGGVSQKPQNQRGANQVSEQVNALVSPAHGLRKRPPTQHLAKLTSDVTGWDDAFVHVINRDEDERYHVVVADGEVQVFDAVAGESIPVVALDGFDYLDDESGKGYRAVTVGDTTIITNRGTTVLRGATKAPTRVHEALLYVRQADFSTLYTVTLDGITVSIRTVDQDTPQSRIGISTEAIASDLKTVLEDQTELNAAFTFTLYGSTLHIIRQDEEDFSLATTDGLADRGLVSVKGSVQSFEDLPARAPNGFIAEVSGAIDTSKDNYFVTFDDLGDESQQGVWRECPKPGTILDLDASTMPHRLVLNGPVGPAAQPHQGLPKIIGASALLKTEGTYDAENWDNVYNDTLGTDLAIVAGVSSSVTDHEAGFRKTFSTGSPRVEIEYIADVVSLESGTLMRVALYKNDDLIASKTYQHGVTKRQFRDFGFDTPVDIATFVVTDIDAADVLTLQIEYSTGESPPVGSRGRLSVQGGSVSVHSGIARRVLIGPSILAGTEARNFPAGSEVTLTLDMDEFVHTVGTTDETPEEVADALVTLVDANPAYTADIDMDQLNSFVVTRADSEDFTVAVTAELELTFHNADLGLTPSDHVGKVLRNETDGSTGTVTANTATTITVSSLSGGVDNIFHRGDLCSIVIVTDPLYFVFEPIPWKDRGAGDLDVVPFPSFIDNKISEVFFYQNRLGFLSNENVVLSSSGDLFNLFRYTATDLRADDVIDVRSAHADVTIFDSAFLWAKQLYVKSNNAWFRVTGDPALTPTTVRLDSIGNYPSYPDPRPVPLGERVYFTRAKSGHTQVFEMSLSEDGESSIAPDITKDLPSYIEGSPLEMVGDNAEGFLALLTDANGQQNLYILSFLFEGRQRVLNAWGRWELTDGTRIIGMGIADGVLSIIRKHSDGAFVELLDLDLTPESAEKVAYLDRRLFSESTPSGVLLDGELAVYDEEEDYTTWTLPYSVATNGSQGDLVVVNRETSEVYTSTRPTATTIRVTGDHAEELVYIGQPYEWLVDPSTIYMRGSEGVPETAGRLQLRYIDYHFDETTDVNINIAPNGRDDVDYTVELDDRDSVTKHVPIMCRNTEVTVRLTNSTPGPVTLSSIDWEGWFTNRNRRI